MSVSINTAFSEQYTSNVRMLSQQRPSRLRGTVTTQSMVGSGGKMFEQVGAVNPVKKTTRHSDTPIISTPHDARWVYPQDYEWADLIDDQDRARTLASFDSPYADAGRMAMNRAIDDEIIAALFATSKTGETGATSTSFPAAQQIAVGGTGLTKDKLIQARKKLLQAEVDLEMETPVLVWNGAIMEDLLNITEVTSADYNTVKALVSGQVDTWMGFRFVHSERLLLNGSSNIRVPVYVPSGVGLGVWIDVLGRVSERDDKSYATQVYCKTTIGATRLEEAKVVEIECLP